ncbi:MAG: hypothetical protein Q7S76_03510 [bacterium]|nr:hypothetical protein [bacterium]
MPRKRKKRSRRIVSRSDQLSWLPIDSRLIVGLFSFRHVSGVARLFLIVEIVLALLVVIGTLLLLIVRFAS